MLDRFVADFLRSESKVTESNATEVLRRLLAGGVEPEREGYFPIPDGIFDEEDDGFAAWLSWGEYLRREFAIEQYALIRWRD